jgi:hypothetical protein
VSLGVFSGQREGRPPGTRRDGPDLLTDSAAGPNGSSKMGETELEPRTQHQNKTKRKVGRAAITLLLALLAAALLLAVQPIVAGPTTQLQATHCVTPDGVGGCASSIGQALAAAHPGDTIRVATGTYTENVVISEAVILEGGWNAAFTIRDPGLFSVTIRPADASKTVVSILGADATVDGFAITGGRAELGSNHGGGMRIVDSNATVRGNSVFSNSAFLLGGGIWVQRGAPTLEDNRIQGNLTLGLGQDAFGGGVQLENSQATLARNIIAGNTLSGTSGCGAGLDMTGGAVAMTNDWVQSNSAGSGDGGGVCVRFSAVLSMQAGTVISNTAVGGGGIRSRSNGRLEMGSSAVISNTALGDGGGILTAASTFISRSTIASNRASGVGGGLLISAALTTLSDTTVSSNAAGGDGAGIWNAAQLRAANDTIANNSGHGLYHHAGGSTEAVNTLLAGNASGNCSGVVFSLGHNLEDGGACGMGQATDLPNTDPLLAGLSDNGGPTPTQAIAPDSPAIDAGDNGSCTATDQRGQPRVDGNGDGIVTCDIGALEYVPPLTAYLPLILRSD